MSGIAGVTAHLGIEYTEVAGFRPLELDLYRPGGAPSRLPVVVHVHGGGWRRGSRRHPLPALGDGFYQGLAGQGIAVAAVDYRLSGEARYPAAADDVRAAVAWVRRALPGYGVMPGPVVLWGDSAGGHLALLAALTSTGPGDTGVDGVVAWFPVTDLTTMHEPGDEAASVVLCGVDWYNRASRPRLPVMLRASPRALAILGEVFGQAAGPALAAALPPDEHGWRVLTLSFEHERAAAHRLAGFGDQVEVLAPPSVRAGLVATARQILGRYDAADDG